MKPTIEITLSRETMNLLARLSTYGVFGETIEEVARRFVDQGVARFLKKPKLRLEKDHD